MTAPYAPIRRCKYTLEGDMVHTLLKNILMVERAKTNLYEGLDLKLTAKDKEKIKEAHSEFVAQGEQNLATFLKKHEIPKEDMKDKAPSLKVEDLPETIPFTELAQVDVISTHVLLN